MTEKSPTALQRQAALRQIGEARFSPNIRIKILPNTNPQTIGIWLLDGKNQVKAWTAIAYDDLEKVFMEIRSKVKCIILPSAR